MPMQRMIACENSGHAVIYDFAEVSKIVAAGAASKPVVDYELTRYGKAEHPVSEKSLPG